MQAATDPTLPNPFFENAVQQPPATGDLGGGVKIQQHSVGAPLRPPPPGSTPGSSPAHSTKSAFDDLNDSIRLALGGSPSKVQQPVAVQMGIQQQQHVTGFGGQQQMYSSPAKQPNVGGLV